MPLRSLLALLAVCALALPLGACSGARADDDDDDSAMDDDDDSMGDDDDSQGDDDDDSQGDDDDDDDDSAGVGMVVLNELLASNDTVNADPAGDFDDWIELYNAGDAAVDLSGWGLTDDWGSEEPAISWLPDGTTLAPGAYLLIWADEDLDQEGLHVDFKLGAGGENLALLDPEGLAVDEVEFPEQTTDISYGRLPDGTGSWAVMSTPTAEASNQ